MSKVPNFEEYSYQNLLAAHRNIDQYQFPDRKALVAKLIEEKKGSDEAKAYLVDAVEVTKYDTFWPRFFAGLIDGILLSVVFYLAGTTTGFFPGWILTLGEYISLFSIYVYSVAFHAYTGQTIGKYFMSLKVVRNTDESAINLKEAFLRDCVPIFLLVFTLLVHSVAPDKADMSLTFSDYLLMFVGTFNFIWFFLEIFTMLLNDKRRALHDYLAGTVVISTY